MSHVHVGARVSQQLADALETASREANTSKSELIRHYLTEGVINSDTELPDHLLREVRRERLKRKNRLTWQRVHFPSNVADRFRRAFEQGDLDGELNPGAVADIKDIYIEDAQILFEDEPERKEAAIQYVEALAKHARDATDASEFDRLDPEEMFEKYGGVLEARERSRTDGLRSELEAEALNRIRTIRNRGGGISSKKQQAITDMLSKQYDVSEDVAADAVEAALGDDR